MLRACLLAAAVSADTFFAAMGCRMSGILIPKRSALAVSVMSTLVLAVSLLGGSALQSVLPYTLCRYGGAVLLTGIGLISVLKVCWAALLRRWRPQIRRRALGLVIEICLDESTADQDGSKVLCLREVPAYALALSMDSLATGLGAGLEGGEIAAALLLTFLLGFLLTVLGNRIRGSRRLSWIGGALLMLLGLLRLR